MKPNEYKSLKNEINNKNFNKGYKGLAKICYYLSFVGNLFSIGLAFFFIENLLLKTVLEPTENTLFYVSAVAILILVTVEATKRFIFDKFSLELIKQKHRFKGGEIRILSFVSLLLIFTSFYLSLNGAKDYADKDKEITSNSESKIEVYQDSIKANMKLRF